MLRRRQRATPGGRRAASPGPSGLGKSTPPAPAEPARRPRPRRGPLPRPRRARPTTCWRCAARSAWCHSCPRCSRAPSPTTSRSRRGSRDATPDVARVLELAGLDASFADRDAGRLSVGEQQRVMLARVARAGAGRAAARRAHLGARRERARLGRADAAAPAQRARPLVRAGHARPRPGRADGRLGAAARRCGGERARERCPIDVIAWAELAATLVLVALAIAVSIWQRAGPRARHRGRGRALVHPADRRSAT